MAARAVARVEARARARSAHGGACAVACGAHLLTQIVVPCELLVRGAQLVEHLQRVELAQARGKAEELVGHLEHLGLADLGQHLRLDVLLQLQLLQPRARERAQTPDESRLAHKMQAVCVACVRACVACAHLRALAFPDLLDEGRDGGEVANIALRLLHLDVEGLVLHAQLQRRP